MLRAHIVFPHAYNDVIDALTLRPNAGFMPSYRVFMSRIRFYLMLCKVNTTEAERLARECHEKWQMGLEEKNLHG